MSILERPWSSGALFELESPFATEVELEQAPSTKEFESDPWAGSPTKSAVMVLTVTVEGQKQGTFRGDATMPSGSMRGLHFSSGVVSPHDVGTGQAASRRLYEPIVFWHAIGPSSPQFFQALTQNEQLKRARFEFKRANQLGALEGVYCIEVETARVIALRQLPIPVQRAERGADTLGLVEEVSLSFATIKVSSTPGNTHATDSWVVPR